MTEPTLKLGTSTAAFFPRPLEEIFDILAPLPWKAVELMPQAPAECFPEFAPRLLALAAGRFDFCAIHFPLILAPFLYNPYPAALEYGQTLSVGLAELAGALGCRVIIVHGPWKNSSQGAFLDATLKNLRLMCDSGLKYGVTIGLENSPSAPLAGTVKDMQDFAALIDRPNLGFTFDLTHAHQMGQDPMDYVAHLPSIAHIHASDFNLETQKRHLLPGKGHMDWDAVLNGLKRRNFQGNFILELLPETIGDDPTAAIGESMALLQPYFDHWNS